MKHIKEKRKLDAKKEQLKKLTGTFDEFRIQVLQFSETNVILFTQEMWVLKFNDKEQIDNTLIQSFLCVLLCGSSCWQFIYCVAQLYLFQILSQQKTMNRKRENKPVRDPQYNIM